MSLPCELCGIPLSDREAMQYQRAHRCANVQLCINYLRAALAHERDRARRVVRVFWRVRDDAGNVEARLGRQGAFHCRSWFGGKVYRVTVRRVAKKAGKVGA